MKKIPTHIEIESAVGGVRIVITNNFGGSADPLIKRIKEAVLEEVAEFAEGCEDQIEFGSVHVHEATPKYSNIQLLEEAE